MKCCIFAVILMLPIITKCGGTPPHLPALYRYKGQWITFQEWLVKIRVKKFQLLQEEYQRLLVEEKKRKRDEMLKPPDEMWIINANQPKLSLSETVPLLRKTRSFNSLNQFGSY